MESVTYKENTRHLKRIRFACLLRLESKWNRSVV